jgi:hypothetical protein
MPLLSELLEKVDDKDAYEVFQAIRKICDQIVYEEKENFKHMQYAPVGSNILITLEVTGRNTKEIGFLHLERESPEVYVAVYSTLEKFRLLENADETPPPRRRTVWPINEFIPIKILTKFASFYKMLRSE